jgi:hypothetical protein
LVFIVPILQFDLPQAVTTGPVLLGLQAVSKLGCTDGSLVQIDSLFSLAVTTGPVLLGLQAVSKLGCTDGSLVQIDSLFSFYK